MRQKETNIQIKCERDKESLGNRGEGFVCVYVCVCVCERERERERERELVETYRFGCLPKTLNSLGIDGGAITPISV